MYEEKFDYKEDLYEARLDGDAPKKHIKNVYYRWKNADDHTWVKITAQEYIDLDRGVDGHKHFFIPEIDRDRETDTIFHEVTESDFKIWDSEREKRWQLMKDMNDSNATDGEKKHRRKKPLVGSIISLDTQIESDDDDESISLHDVVADPDSLFEDDLIFKLWIHEMVDSLPPEEREVINTKFFSANEELSDLEVSRILNIPRKTINNRKLSAFEKISKLMAKTT